MGKFKLGLDWHGVIDATPQLWSHLTNIIVDGGGEVHILTGMTWNSECERQLEEWGIKWTHSFSILDYHQSINTPTIGWHDKFNIPRIDDVTWDKTKGDYARKHQLDLHIDDTLQYNDYFTTPFARFFSHNNRPKGQHKDTRHLN